MEDRCPFCGAEEDYCHCNDNFHQLLRKHGVPCTYLSGVGDGWLPLLDEILTGLKKMGWHGELEQIKEKWGILTIYASGLTDKMEKYLDEMCKKSEHICEVCGKSGRLICNHGWYSVRCPEHENKVSLFGDTL